MVPLLAAVLLLASASGPDTLGSPIHKAIPAPQRSPTSAESSDRWLALDKFWHLSASFVTVGATYHFCRNRMGTSGFASTGTALGGTFALGLTKEVGDLCGPSRRFSWKDLAADAVGVALGYLVFIHRY